MGEPPIIKLHEITTTRTCPKVAKLLLKPLDYSDNSSFCQPHRTNRPYRLSGALTSAALWHDFQLGTTMDDDRHFLGGGHYLVRTTARSPCPSAIQCQRPGFGFPTTAPPCFARTRALFHSGLDAPSPLSQFGRRTPSLDRVSLRVEANDGPYLPLAIAATASYSGTRSSAGSNSIRLHAARGTTLPALSASRCCTSRQRG